jgi:serine/threonine-protein kinase HipA
VSDAAGPEATVDALMSVIPYFRISRDRARAILGDVEASVATWRRQARALGMSSDDLDSFADAFEHPERDAARRVLK